MTQTQYSEQQFMKWVSFVGSLKHTLFNTANNKLFPSYTVTVDKNPAAGDFTSIQDAIDSLPFVNLLRVVIKVHAGVYTEKVNIPPLKSFITIEGAGAEKTIVQWGDTAQTPGPKGLPLGTFASATFAANSPYFIAKNITFKNTTPVPAPGAIGKQAVAFRISADTAAFLGCRFLGAQDTLYDHMGRHYYKDCYIEGSVDFIFGNGLSLFENTTPVPAPGAIGKQAVAFRISADTAAFLGCRFLGAQDTLYDHMGRHYYKDCYIEGSVDFIFGNGLSLFEGCHVHAIAPVTGALTAQGRSSLLEDTGFSFLNCKVTGSGALYLGRAWGPFSRVVFAYTYMDNIIIPKGWYNWGDPNREM
ncbi:unnamed protein product [Ilex paraguariensis]|uniref:Pectinesterase n=1 Tax=Ilex paraguariensis TaxID=185542 RepID=A0ABC8TTG8_9AQUA